MCEQKNYSKDERFNIWYDKKESGTYRKSSTNIHIIHLTDIHLYLGSKPEEKKGQKSAFSNVCDKIQQRFKKETTYILITGDLANSNDAVTINKEFDEFVKILKDKLNGFENILLCPGNHDYGSGGFIYRKDSHAYFNELFKNTTVIDSLKEKPLPDEKILFIGLNSMTNPNRFNYTLRANNGKINNDDLTSLTNIRTSSEFKDYIKIIYMHHAAFTEDCPEKPKKKIINSKKFEDELKEPNQTSILLYGHRHIDREPFNPEDKDNIHVIESNALYKADGYYVIEIKQ